MKKQPSGDIRSTVSNDDSSGSGDSGETKELNDIINSMKDD